MLFRKKKKESKNKNTPEKEVKIITCSLDDVRKAVNAYALSLQEGVSLRSLANENNEINYELLYSHLGGKPDKSFYISKETFEVFEDPDYPRHIDLCQIACDQYFLETGEEPVVPGDPDRKVSYFKLRNYLSEKPHFELYLHPKDQMVTHRSPKQNK
jgi:hypothetical protein